MEIMKLNCASCGSPIQIQSDTEFLTCPFCSTQLAVDSRAELSHFKDR